METQPEFGFKELVTHLIGDMAKAVSERPGESQQQQTTRLQAATYTVVGLHPRDVIEAMLAGHCMLFHELLVDSMRNTMRGEADTVRRATRSSLVTMNQAFDNCLSRLEYYQTRPSEGSRDATTTAAGETEARAPAGVTRKQDAPARTSVAEKQTTRTRPEESSPQIGTRAAVAFSPSQEAIDACIANPEAMAALEACDPERFARAMGIDQPSTSYIAAASVQMAAQYGKASGNGRADGAGKVDGLTVRAAGNGTSNPHSG
jgi:hypothetical protein